MRRPPFLRQFADPDPRFSPAPIWWWSGEKLDIDRLRWQLDRLSAMHIRNVVVLNLAPSGPLFGCPQDDPPFLSEPWWEIFSQVCDHAKRIGTFVWFYDQIGFSGANYQADLVAANPQFGAHNLRITSVEGAGELRVRCPGAGSPLAAYVYPIARPKEVQFVELRDREAVANASEPSRLKLIYTVRQGYDYLSPAACQALLDTVHRQFEKRLPQHLGTTIVGSFQDELPDMPTWGELFAESFAAAFGYRIEPVLHHLFEEADPASRRTRMHYQQHRAALAEEAFFKPFYAWHESHGLICGFDQQSPAREGIPSATVAKYADYLRTHRWYAAPGCDLHGHMKIHSSMAYLHRRPRVWIEGFHSTGWGGTIADTLDWLLPFFQNGANLYNPHAVYYSTRKGWFEWAPPSTCWRQPYAMHYPAFADMIARLTKLLSHGREQLAAAVLFPTTSVQSASGPGVAFDDARTADEVVEALTGSMTWHKRRLGLLDELNIPHVLVDDESLAELDVPTLILPGIAFMESATMSQLRKLADQGVRILVIGRAIVATEAAEADLSQLPGVQVFASADAAREALAQISPAVRAPVPILHRREGSTNILFVPAVAGMTTTITYRDWFAYFEQATADPGKYLPQARLTLPPAAKAVYRFDPLTGEASQVAMEGTTLSLDFEGAPFAVLVWDENDSPNPAEPAPMARKPAASEIRPLSEKWAGEYVATFPAEYNDICDPDRPELAYPHTAQLLWQRESDPPMPVLTTYGIHGDATYADGTVKPVAYSTQFGIERDDSLPGILGPKGHVPEEFLDFGKVPAGDAVVYRTHVHNDRPRKAILAVGANAAKSVHLNGRELQPGDPEAYLALFEVELPAGRVPLRLSFTPDRETVVRGYFCFVDPERVEEFRRPERIKPTTPPVEASLVSYRRAFEIDSELVEGVVQVAIAAVTAVYVDDVLIGRQGGTDPYKLSYRAQPHALPKLSPGRHELRVDVLEPARGALLMVDLRARTASGQTIAVMSDRSFKYSRDSGPAIPVRLDYSQEREQAAYFLYRRPHPLPHAAWLEGEQPAVVLDLAVDGPAETEVPQTFRWTVPPGAVRIHLPLVNASDVRLLIDGTEHAPQSPLPAGGGARQAELRVRSRYLAGGLFTGPITYEFAEGIIESKPWPQQGLRSYSGAIRLRQDFDWSENARQAVLDLGCVRGTVEAALNGRPLGVRVVPPYTFDLTEALRPGRNTLNLVITSTLGNFLSTWSPTRSWSEEQLAAGLSTPACIRWERSPG